MPRNSKLARGAIIAGAWLMLWCPAAYAHGGIAGPDELGPPVITSAILGIACYWAVMLWPSRRNGSRNEKSAARRARR